MKLATTVKNWSESICTYKGDHIISSMLTFAAFYPKEPRTTSDDFIDIKDPQTSIDTGILNPLAEPRKQRRQASSRYGK